MINCAVLFDYNNKFVAVISHDTVTGKLFIKTRTKLVYTVITDRLSTDLYKEVEENGLTLLEKADRIDDDFLEVLVDSLSDYYAYEYLEQIDAQLKNFTREKFDQFGAKGVTL